MVDNRSGVTSMIDEAHRKPGVHRPLIRASSYRDSSAQVDAEASQFLAEIPVSRYTSGQCSLQDRSKYNSSETIESFSSHALTAARNKTFSHEIEETKREVFVTEATSQKHKSYPKNE